MTIPDDRGAAALAVALANGTSLPLAYRQRLAEYALGERAVFLPDGLDLDALTAAVRAWWRTDHDHLTDIRGEAAFSDRYDRAMAEFVLAFLRSTSPEPRP